MPKHHFKWNILGRRIIALLLLCGLILPVGQNVQAASVTFRYTWVKDASGLPTDNQWHDYFIAWEDLDDKKKVWFTDYHWYTSGGDSNIDEGGTHWMEYKAASTLPNYTDASFTSKDQLGHMQIKYAGMDTDNNSPKYYIRVSKMHGGYSYFSRYEPEDKEKDADAFTFQDKGDVFHIFVNISGKGDRYLTRNDDYLETTESSSAGGGESYRHLRVYQRTFFTEEETEVAGDVIGKVTMYEYSWVNTVEELMALANNKDWTNILLAWEDRNDSKGDPNKVWYAKGVWYDAEGKPNYENKIGNRWFYYSSDYLGSDGYGSPQGERFVLPTQVGHFQVKTAGWDDDNPVHGYKDANGKQQDSPKFQFRFDIGRGRYVYIGNNAFYDDPDDVEDYTVQLRLGKKDADDLYGSVWIINNIKAAQDELFCRCNNYFGIGNWNHSDYWEFPFRIYTYREVEYDAIVKSFTVGKGATYSIDRQLILNEGVTITVEDGGVLMVDKELMNNGNIVVKNGGTVIVNEGAYVMPYDYDTDGKITLDGGNMLIMDNAKVICDESDGSLRAINGSTITNRGLLMVGNALELRNNTCLKNEATGLLVVGGRIGQERGGVDAFSYAQIEDRITDEDFVCLTSVKSKLINKGSISVSSSKVPTWNDDGSGGVIHLSGGTIRLR